MYFLYILKSDSAEWYYVGVTENLDSRLKRHNSGLVRSTKSRKPYKVVYFEEYLSKANARKRELVIKSNWKIKQEIISKIKASSSNG